MNEATKLRGDTSNQPAGMADGARTFSSASIRETYHALLLNWASWLALDHSGCLGDLPARARVFLAAEQGTAEVAEGEE